MKILYTVEHANTHNTITRNLSLLPEWDVYLSSGGECTLKMCSTDYYDVLIIDSTINNNTWLNTIKEIRDRQIFTPILVITDSQDRDSLIAGLTEGADMCIAKPFDLKEIVLRIRVLKRRNTNYQSPTITFSGIRLHRPDGKICYGNTSLSVSPIEIEVFRLLARASTEIHTSALAEKMNEQEEKVIFSAKCLQKKINLLGAPIKLHLNRSKCQLIPQTIKDEAD